MKRKRRANQPGAIAIITHKVLCLGDGDMIQTASTIAEAVRRGHEAEAMFQANAAMFDLGATLTPSGLVVASVQTK